MASRPTHLLHLAYDLRSPEAIWMARLGTAYRQLMPELKESFAFCYRTSATGTRMHLPHGYQAESVTKETFYGVLGQLTEEASWPAMSELYKRAQCARLSERLEAAGFGHILRGVRDHGVEDVRAFASGLPDGSGFLFASFDPESWQASPRTQKLWSMVTAHISQAMRLRRSLQGEVEGADWIFDPAQGTCLHATDAAQPAPVRQRLAQMARQLDALRLGQVLSQEERVAKWAELVSGQWTLAQAQEPGGRRLILAIHNAPQAKVALSPLQAEILKLMLQGHSLTFIAYELERAYSTILHHLERLRGQFMVSSNIELIELAYTWLHEPGVPISVGRNLIGLYDAQGKLDHADLSAAEDDLVECLRRGHTDAQIAQVRGVQVKTVQNQLHTLYGRFGVHSRTELLVALRDGRTQDQKNSDVF